MRETVNSLIFAGQTYFLIETTQGNFRGEIIIYFSLQQ